MLATDPRFSDAFRRIDNRTVMDGLIETLFAAEPHETMIERLDAAGIAYAMVNTPIDLAEHPHLRRIDVATDSGTVAVPAPPARRRGLAPAFGAVPSIDADGAAIRREFG